MTVHIDISQLLIDPRRTGIQRAERELIRHWPGPAPLRPCLFDAARGGLRVLPNELLRALCDDAQPGGLAAEMLRLAPMIRPGAAVAAGPVLNAELFADPARAAFYRQAPDAVRPFWLVYDFLPWLHPDWFSLGSAARLMPYLRALLRVKEVAFISARTRDEYARLIVHGAAEGPVIPMGADGLGLERQAFDPAKRRFVMLGTVEPRKNALPAMEAFRLLWREGVEAELLMIGLASPTDAEREIATMRMLEGETRFQHLSGVPDRAVRDALRGARALLFPSDGEGFGIPPMEALHSGIPVIVSETLPAIVGQPALGQIRLGTVTAASIADAVRTMMDDAACARLWAEAAQMRVPGWADFARDVAAWVQGSAGG